MPRLQATYIDAKKRFFAAIEGQGMELHEFIATTLQDIQLGVQTAIDNAIKKDMRGAINPVWGTVDDADRSHIQNVKFDIAVTVSERAAGSAKAGINVVAMRVGDEGSLVDENSRVSRIQFSIPLIPPATVVTPPRK